MTRLDADGAEPPADPRLPPRWRLLRLVGRGGQAVVWLAHDQRLERAVAVKVFTKRLDPDTLHRLRREVNLGRELQHPNLVRVYELIEGAGVLAVAMEWLPGGSYKKRLGEGPIPITEVARLADETLAALAFLHEHRIVHRDVKPSNLLIDGEGHVRLADLGLVKPLDDPATTRAEVSVGTPTYMSPEQLRGQSAEPASDLYALGATLFELVTGRPPYPGGHELEVAERHLHATIPDPRKLRPDCPRWLARFIRRLLEKAPGDRWSDAGAAREALTRKRSLVSPRLVRRAAFVAALAVGAAALGLLVSWLTIAPMLHGASRVEISGRAVLGKDAKGRTLWTHAFGSPVQQLESVDLEGDGNHETIAVAFPVSARRDATETESEVAILDRNGRVIEDVRPEQLLRSWPSVSRKLVDPFVKAIDIDRDGRPEVVVLCTSRDSFHAAVVVYWPRSRRWTAPFLNSGYIRDIRATPASEPPGLRLLAFNNELGMVAAVAQLSLTQPREVEKGPFDGGSIVSPPEGGGFGETPEAKLDWYTLLPQSQPDDDVMRFGPAAAGEAVVETQTGRIRIDRWANPVPGPNAGADLSELRGWTLSALAGLVERHDAHFETTILARADEVRDRARRLMAESPYRVVLAESVAARLARAGFAGRARDVLAAAYRVDPYEDIALRLALLDLFAGDAASALPRLRAVWRSSLTPAGGTRAPRTLMYAAVDGGDEATFREVLATFAPRGAYPAADVDGLAAALWARARLWWDRPESVDETVTSWSLAPEGEAVACLARWRLGHGGQADVERMERFVRDNPDMALPGEVARGAALLAAGKAPDAVAELGRVVQSLDVGPLDERDQEAYTNFQFAQLARALRARALLAAGDRDGARREARALRSELTPHRLPWDLVEEVLTGADPR